MAAGNAVIGALRAELGLDSAQFEQGIRRAQGTLDKFGIQLTLGLETVAEQVGRVLGALPNAIKASIDRADDFAKLSQRIGLSVEALTRLEHAANLSGVSMAQLQTGFVQLARQMGNIASGAGGTAKVAFEALGVAVQNADGSLRDSQEVFNEIATLFSRMEDGATKTAIATQLFGRSGAELIPLLNEGAAGLKEFADESDRLGLTLSGETAAAAELFNDNMDRVKGAMSGVVNQIMIALLPSLNNIASTLASPEMHQAITTFTKWIGEGFNFVIQAATFVINVIQNVIDTFASLEGKSAGALDAMLANFGADRVRIENEILMMESKMRQGVRNIGRDILSTRVEELKGQLAELTRAEAEILAVLDERRARGELGRPPGAPSLTEPPEIDPLEVTIPNVKELTEAEKELNRVMEEGKRIAESLRDPFQIMADEIANLDRLLAAGAISWETYTAAVDRSRWGAVESVAGMASQTLGILGGLFKENKAFAVAQAVLAGVEGVARTMGAYPFPWNMAMAAAHAVAAAAQVATVLGVGPTSKSMPGTPGAPAPSAPGDATAGQGAGGTVVVNMSGKKGVSYSDEEVRALMQRISELTADGYRVVLGT